MRNNRHEYETPRWAQYVLWALILFGCVAPLVAEPICEPDKFLATLTMKAQMDCPKDLADGATCLLFISDTPDVGYVAIVWNDILMAIIQLKADGTKEFIYQAIQIQMVPKEEPWKCEGVCA